jgi:hypothetical protein
MHDILSRPIPIEPRITAGSVVFEPPSEPFPIGMPLTVPGFGRPFVYADNCGEGYTSRSLGRPAPLPRLRVRGRPPGHGSTAAGRMPRRGTLRRPRRRRAGGRGGAAPESRQGAGRRHRRRGASGHGVPPRVAVGRGDDRGRARAAADRAPGHAAGVPVRVQRVRLPRLRRALRGALRGPLRLRDASLLPLRRGKGPRPARLLSRRVPPVVARHDADPPQGTPAHLHPSAA